MRLVSKETMSDIFIVFAIHKPLFLIPRRKLIKRLETLDVFGQLGRTEARCQQLYAYISCGLASQRCIILYYQADE